MTPSTATPARPTTSADLAARIAAAGGREDAAAGAQVRITGSGSLPLLAFAPERPTIDISTLRMNKVLEHAPADMTVIVQAGISLEALQRHLAWQNQWLPIDPPAIAGRLPGQRTLGGLIATNSLGPLRFGCGDWRLLVLGMKYIDAAGTLLSSGSRTVKNVAGYAVHRLMIGSGGALGVISEVTLRTFSRPPDEQCLILFCDSAAQAETLLSEVLVSWTTPAYVQVIGGITFAGNPLELPTISAGGGENMAVVVGFLGRPETCAKQIDTLRQLPAARRMESIAQTAAQAGRLRLWMTTEPAANVDAGGVGFRLHVRSSNVARLVAQLEALSGDRAWIISEAATGVIRGTLTDVTSNTRSAFARVCEETHARPFLTQGTLAAHTSAPNEITARLKAALDPQHRFGKLRS